MTHAGRRTSAGRAGGGRPLVTLIAMPWQPLYQPSIQLGLLKSVLLREGVGVDVRALNLALMEHCLRAAAADGRNPFTLADYERVSSFRHNVGLGDWVFAGPPFRRPGAHEATYLDYLRSCGTPEDEISQAVAIRG